MGSVIEREADWARLEGRIPEEVTATLGQAALLGFLGPMELGDQIDHALGFVVACEGELPGGVHSVLDLGTGGGLPGLVVGCCWPGCRVVLVDANLRRTEFLRSELAAIPALDNVEVVRCRAEDLARDPSWREQFEVVTARSFGPPAVTAECGSPFLRPAGLLVVSEPPETDDPGRWPGEGLALLGLTTRTQVRVGGRYGYQLLGRMAAISDRYPRRTGIPVKRPLF